MALSKPASFSFGKGRELSPAELLKRLSANGIKIKPSLLKLYKRLTIFVSFFLIAFFCHAQTEVKSFKATFTGTKTKLMWQVEAGTRFSYFSIEKSLDGKHFETICLVKNENNINDYIFFDKDYFTNMVYYRLRGNTNGNVSIVASLTAIQLQEDIKEFVVYPVNTLTGSLYADVSKLQSDKIIVDVKDADGMLISNKTFDENTNETAFEVRSFRLLTKGEYTVSVFYNEKVFTTKLMIEDAIKNISSDSEKSKNDLAALK